MFQTDICCDCKKIQFCRNSMLGVCSTIARVGGVAAPWIAVYLPTQVAFFNPLYTHRTLLMNDLHRLNQIKKSFLFFCRVPWTLRCHYTSSAEPLLWLASLLLLASQSPLGHLCPKTLRWPTNLSWSSWTDDICPSLGLEKDEGERQAYLEVHLAKEEGERGGGRGRVKSSSRGIKQGQRISKHLWWHFKTVAIYVMIVYVNTNRLKHNLLSWTTGIADISQNHHNRQWCNF